MYSGILYSIKKYLPFATVWKNLEGAMTSDTNQIQNGNHSLNSYAEAILCAVLGIKLGLHMIGKPFTMSRTPSLHIYYYMEHNKCKCVETENKADVISGQESD